MVLGRKSSLPAHTLRKQYTSAKMNKFLLVASGLLFAISTLLLLDSKRREAILSILYIRRRKASGTFTPPRSLSPKKQGLPPNDPPASPHYGDVFPPHRREALAELSPGALKGPGKSAKELSEIAPDYSKLTPDTEICNTDEFLQHATATGFTVEEIKRLGDFPDYATLSGVPLPDEYKEFDITGAKPRPYRPFRWAYHQTMCMLICNLLYAKWY